MSALRSIAKIHQPTSANAAFLEADYDAVIMLLDANRSPEDDVLLSQAYMRMRAFDNAIRVLNESVIRDTAMGLALRAAIEIRRERYDDARALLEKAVPTSDSERDRIRYESAMLAIRTLDNDRCEDLLRQPIPTLEQQADELRAWIKIRQAKYREAANLLVKAADGPDLWTRYNVLTAASFIAREMYHPEVMRRIELLATTTPNRCLAQFQCHIMRASGWFLALEGEFSETLRRFRHAARYANTTPWKIALLADRSYVSLAFGNSENGWDDLDEALDMAHQMEWAKSQGEERRVLLTLAALIADWNTAEAQWCLKTYFDLKPTDTSSEWSRDIRSRAFEDLACAHVARAVGKIQEASRYFTRAFSTFHAIGYEWRAMLTLLARENLVNSGAAVPQYIQMVLKQYPKSWMRALVEAQIPHGIDSPTEVAGLTTMERKVLSLLAECKTNPQIASALGRRPKTITHHVTNILRKLDCSSRKELIRKYAAAHLR